MKNANFDVAPLIRPVLNKEFSLEELINAGYTPEQILARYDLKEFKKVGYTFEQLRKVSFNQCQLKTALYPEQDFINAGLPYMGTCQVKKN